MLTKPQIKRRRKQLPMPALVLTETVFLSRWPTTPEEIARLNERKCMRQIEIRQDKYQTWLYLLLYGTERYASWKIAHVWGNRVFDYFEPALGLAVMLDPADSVEIVNEALDRWNWAYSAIRVVHVRAENRDDVRRVHRVIETSRSWQDRLRDLVTKFGATP
jgi:hypothetical protein